MFFRKPFLLALAAATGTQIFAKDPAEFIRLGMSLRAGYAQSADDQLSRGGFGIGLNGEFRLNEKFSIVGEFGYWANTGRQHIVPFQPPAPGQEPADPTWSVDTRKNSLTSLHLRGLGRYDFSPKVSFQGGVQVGKSRFRHEYIAQYADSDWNYADTVNGTPTESAVKVSPVLGLQYAFDKDTTIELNLVGLSYSAIDFRHTPGAPLVSGDPNQPGSRLIYEGDTLVKSNRMTVTVELGYTFRF